MRGLYRYRFVHRAARYVQWISVPLALWGAPKVRGPVGRLLAAWAVVTAAGVAFGLATGLLPPDRFVTFGYVVPLLAAVGAMRLWRSLHPRRAVATLVVAALVTLMALGSFFAWRREKPFLTQAQVGAVTDASGWIGATPPGTPLFFVVETGDDTITFFATQAENTIRAAVPPERIPDVHILVLPGEAPPGSERAILSRSTLDDYLIAASGASPVTMELRPFAAPIYGVNAPGLPAPLVELAPGLAAAGLPDGPAPAASDPLEPTSPAQISLAAFEVLAVLGLAGYGWARAAGLHAAAAAALAPAFGLGALTLAALALERVGVPLGGSAGPTAVSLAAGAGGFCARYLLERRPAR
ncbi:MAG: hypothetical protein HY240_05105 [Actinobacteria bacterium]|nr:hypothetical protein [Actinomycetota bacterium]